MPAKSPLYYDDLLPLIRAVDAPSLEAYLTERSNLPGPRGNLELIHQFTDAVGSVMAQPDAPAVKLTVMLHGWAAIPVDAAPSNHPREILPAAAAAFGQIAALKPDTWDKVVATLRHAASDKRWRTRELVAAALQRMLDADWTRTCALLVEWAADGSPLEIRAAVAAVAEPSLLKDKARAEDALAVQAEGINNFLRIPQEHRRDEDVRTLRQALGYTLSVVTAASPETGFHLMEEIAALPDPDIIWIVRENVKKKRLQPWQDRIETIETAMFRPE